MFLSVPSSLFSFLSLKSKNKNIFKMTNNRAKFIETRLMHEKISLALAGVTQWIECWPSNQRVTSSIPSQGTYLGCKPCPQ